VIARRYVPVAVAALLLAISGADPGARSAPLASQPAYYEQQRSPFVLPFNTALGAPERPDWGSNGPFKIWITTGALTQPTHREATRWEIDYGVVREPPYTNGRFPIRAPATGVVVYAESPVSCPECGQTLIVRHSLGNPAGSMGSMDSRYLHLHAFNVSVGQVVQQGDLIALAGNTGTVAEHLHFGIRDYMGSSCCAGTSLPIHSIPGQWWYPRYNPVIQPEQPPFETDPCRDGVPCGVAEHPYEVAPLWPPDRLSLRHLSDGAVPANAPSAYNGRIRNRFGAQWIHYGFSKAPLTGGSAGRLLLFNKTSGQWEIRQVENPARGASFADAPPDWDAQSYVYGVQVWAAEPNLWSPVGVVDLSPRDLFIGTTGAYHPGAAVWWREADRPSNGGDGHATLDIPDKLGVHPDGFFQVFKVQRWDPATQTYTWFYEGPDWNLRVPFGSWYRVLGNGSETHTSAWMRAG
jgi:murein DD-endopeptidase MepM/ murein hydrolase activator NlpD